MNDRRTIVNKDIGILEKCGLIVSELDLRKYFGGSQRLKKYIDSFNPGLIFSMGGNLYSLATALKLSGIDNILQEDLKQDKYVYGGYSAGSMVASCDLSNYLDSYGRRSGDRLEQARELYGEAFTNGLGLIDEYIVPHADEEKFKDACREAEASISSKGLTAIVLNNSDVVVMNGENMEILRKEDRLV